MDTNRPKKTRNDHRSADATTNSPLIHASALVGEPYPLPPTPVRLLDVPAPALLASDGTFSVPVLSDGPERGWSVFDEQGRMLWLLTFQRGHKLVAEELRILDIFEAGRAALCDPQFAEYDPHLREREARQAPSGAVAGLNIFYDHYGPAADGSRSVMTYSSQQPESWLVLDVNGRFIEGRYFPSDEDWGTPVGERFGRFLRRRARVGDPALRAAVESVRAANVSTDGAGARGER